MLRVKKSIRKMQLFKQNILTWNTYDDIVTLNATKGGVFMKERLMSIERSRKLKSLIVKAGLDMSQTAEMMKMSRATLSGRINGKTDFSRVEMENFAKIVNESPSFIFFE